MKPRHSNVTAWMPAQNTRLIMGSGVAQDTRVDEDGAPSYVQHCEYIGSMRWVHYRLFDGQEGELSIDVMPVLESALSCESSYTHRKTIQSGAPWLTEEQLRTEFTEDFVHTMYQMVELYLIRRRVELGS